MPCFPIRWKRRKGDLPAVPASTAMDLGIFHELYAPKDPLRAARQLPGTDPEEFSTLCRHRRPWQGWGLSTAELWNREGSRNSRGAWESWRDTGMPGEVGDAPAAAEANGKKPGSCRNAEGGKAQREKPRDKVPSGIAHLGREKVPSGIPHLGRENVPSGIPHLGREKVPSGIPHLGKDARDEPVVPARARNGHVPRKGMDRPRSPLQAGIGEDEQGASGGSSQSPESSVGEDAGAAAASGGAGNAREEPEPPSAAGTPGAEPRRRLWEKLSRLGEDMEKWEGKSTRELAARLAEAVLERDTKSYPTEPGTRSVRRERGAGAARDLELGVPVSTGGSEPGNGGNEPGNDGSEPGNGGSEPGNGGSLLGMLALCGNGNSTEHSEGSEQSDEDVPVRILQVRVRGGSLEEEFPAVWARSRVDCGRVAEELLLLPRGRLPFQKQHPKPPHVEALMAELLREYLAAGIVVEGRSRSNNPLILVPKSNGRGWRLTLHCRALDGAIPAEPSERLDPAEIAASVHPQSRYFSVLDLSAASLAIPLARCSWESFAFTFQGRQFLFTRLPPTFRSSIVHRRVDEMLAQLEPGAAPGVLHYCDDILIAGESRRQAEYRTRRVLELIQRTGFKARREKAQLVRPEVTYLGITLGAEGRRIPEEKLEDIREACDAPGAWNAHGLRSLLGKFNSWRNHIPDYSELALPLESLAGKRSWDWEWGPEQERQLRRLKEALEAAPVLRFPDKSRPFLVRLRLHADTAGATLLQEGAGTLLPVGHSSRRLSGRGFSPPERRCLAAVRAVRAFQSLTGPAPVVIWDPSGSHLVRGDAFGSGGSGGSGGSESPERWTLLLTSRGRNEAKSQMVVIPPAPPLSELPSDVPESHVWFLAVEKAWCPEPSVGFAAANLEERWLLGACRGAAGPDAELEALRELLEQHRSSSPLYLYSGCPSLAARLEGREEPGWNSGGDAWPDVLRRLRAFPGMLHVREVGRDPAERDWIGKVAARASTVAGTAESGRKIWEPSKYEKQEIISWCHRQHANEVKTMLRVQEVGSWENYHMDVLRWVLKCPECGYTDPDSDSDSDSDPDPAAQRAEGPWSSLRISLSGNLPETPEGFCALLAVRDEFSGWLEAFPLRRRAEPDVRRLLLREVFERFGKVDLARLAPAPAWLRNSMNRAPLRHFRSRLEVSGRCEAAACLARVAQAAGSDWARMLPLILAGIRSAFTDKERLGPLLSVPDLPVELRWEGPGPEPSQGNELALLRGMPVQPGYRERLERAVL